MPSKREVQDSVLGTERERTRSIYPQASVCSVRWVNAHVIITRYREGSTKCLALPGFALTALSLSLIFVCWLISLFVALARLKLMVLLPHPLECWDCKHEPLPEPLQSAAVFTVFCVPHGRYWRSTVAYIARASMSLGNFFPTHISFRK